MEGNYLYWNHDPTERVMFVHHPESLNHLRFGYYSDKEYVYQIDKHIGDSNDWKRGIVDGVSPNEIFFYSNNEDELSGTGSFMKLTNKISFIFNEHIATKKYEIAEVDSETFEVVKGKLTRDRKNVYYGQFKLENLNPNNLDISFIDFGYIMDDESVFFNSKKLAGVSSKKFRPIEQSSYSDTYFTDNKAVYILGHKLEDVDVDDFYTINLGGHLFGSDGLNVYYRFNIMDGMDPDTVYAENFGRGYLERSEEDAVVIRDEDTFWAKGCDNFSCSLRALEDEDAYERYKENAIKYSGSD